MPENKTDKRAREGGELTEGAEEERDGHRRRGGAFKEKERECAKRLGGVLEGATVCSRGNYSLGRYTTRRSG